MVMAAAVVVVIAHDHSFFARELFEWVREPEKIYNDIVQQVFFLVSLFHFIV